MAKSKDKISFGSLGESRSGSFNRKAIAPPSKWGLMKAVFKGNIFLSPYLLLVIQSKIMGFGLFSASFKFLMILNGMSSSLLLL